MDRNRSRLKRVAVGAAFVLSSGVMIITLPLIPAHSLHNTPVVAANYDAGETVGWATYVREIASVYQPGQIILASNYGEAGAVDRFGRGLGLPEAFSGQTGYWYWGPPPGAADHVLAIGFDPVTLDASFQHCDLATTLDNHLDIHNDEQHAPVW